jgi:hypothetical protein
LRCTHVPPVPLAGCGRQPVYRDPLVGDAHDKDTALRAARRRGRGGRGAGSRLHARGGRDRRRPGVAGDEGPPDRRAHPSRSGSSSVFSAVLAPAAPAGWILVPLIGKSSFGPARGSTGSLLYPSDAGDTTYHRMRGGPRYCCSTSMASYRRFFSSSPSLTFSRTSTCSSSSTSVTLALAVPRPTVMVALSR